MKEHFSKNMGKVYRWESRVRSLLKGLVEKLFNSNQKKMEEKNKTISQDEIEALIDAKVKEHTDKIQSTLNTKSSQQQLDNGEDYLLTPKQVDYALSLIDKIKNDFELSVDPTTLTIKDLNRLIAYQKYKNKGTLINLVKKGVLRKR